MATASLTRDTLAGLSLTWDKSGEISASLFDRKCNPGPFRTSIGEKRKESVMTSSAAKGSGFGKILGVATLGALVWFARKPKPQGSKGDGHSAAFADGETNSENFDQTRSAGPDGMRDDMKRPWENVDQASDESFPASDPPATY